MGLAFYAQAIAYQQKHKKPGMQIHNTLQTNAVTLDEAWCAFFKRHDFLLGVSMDGPEKLHDRYRVDKGGAPTFSRVMRGIRLLQKHGVPFNILTTVHAANADFPLDIYRFMRDEVGRPSCKSFRLSSERTKPVIRKALPSPNARLRRSSMVAS